VGTTAYSFQELCLIAPQCDDDHDDKAVEECSIIVVQLVIIIGGQQGGNSGRGRSMRTKPIFALGNFSLLDNNIPSCQAAAHIES
jgi:hypothetical protein